MTDPNIIDPQGITASVAVQASDVTIPLLSNALKFLQGPIGALIMSQAIDSSSVVNTVTHQNFWLGLVVTMIGGALQHLRADTANKNTASALGFITPSQQ